MDIISHGLYGGIAFGQKNKRDYWWSFVFGIAPDFFSFGVFTAMTALGVSPRYVQLRNDAVPQYVHSLYNVTHSLVIFAVVFLIVWTLHKKPFLPMLAWPLHILVDIPLHSTAFFPTPFFWPFFNNLRVNGIPWGEPIILIPNVILLVVLYSWLPAAARRREEAGFLS